MFHFRIFSHYSKRIYRCSNEEIKQCACIFHFSRVNDGYIFICKFRFQWLGDVHCKSYRAISVIKCWCNCDIKIYQFNIFDLTKHLSESFIFGCKYMSISVIINTIIMYIKHCHWILYCQHFPNSIRNIWDH